MLKKAFTIIIYIFAFIGLWLTAGYFAIRFGLTNTSGIIDTQRDAFLASGKDGVPQEAPYWSNLPEWTTLKTAIIKDKAVIQKAADSSGVPARLIVAPLIAEQLRFFYTDRESYKKFFEPLKILGSETQFSWGVMGVKEDTAVQIEKNLKNPASPYYPGIQYASLLDFTATDSMGISQERFTRMTDQHNHYYSYLYAGLYLREIETQWKSAGFDISARPDILTTLYNTGFKNSVPNSNPFSGGSQITIATKTYSFGLLGDDFYKSSELLEEFPR
jgi:hypothetical protein